MSLKKLFERISKEQKIDPENLEASFDHFAADKLFKSETMQKALGVQESEMEELYEEAYAHYMDNCFDKALPLFRWLAIFNPFERRYWIGFAATHQLIEDYHGALKGYKIAVILDNKDPFPHYHAYECYLALGNEREGALALDDARIRAAKHSIYSGLRQEIDEIMRGQKYV